MVAYHGEPTKQNVEYWIKKRKLEIITYSLSKH
jgi:hypothetical protein